MGRGGLNFKGESDKTKKKRRAEKAADIPGVPKQEIEKAPTAAEQVPMIEGSGRIVSSHQTLHGFHTAFKEEVEVGDTIVVHNETTLELEMRTITGVLSQKSATIHQAFSKDFISTTEYHIRKDSLRLKEKVKEQLEADESAESIQDAASLELQKQLDKKLKKARKEVTIREKTGMWGYKTTTKKYSKETTAEEALDERCKQGRDKYCF